MNDDATETFHGVVDQVLRDIARAQLAADRRSEQIAGIYGETPILRTFPVPYLKIATVDIDLRYALVLREDEPGESPKSPASSEQVITNAANRLADATVKIVTKFGESGHRRVESEQAEESLLDQSVLAEHFERSLSELTVRGELTNTETESSTAGTEPGFERLETSQDNAGRFLDEVDAKLATARREVVLAQLFRELWQTLAERDSLLCELIDRDPGIEELRLLMVTAWLPIVEELERWLRGEDGGTSGPVSRYALILDARQLAELPEKAVSSASLHIDLAGGKSRSR